MMVISPAFWLRNRYSALGYCLELSARLDLDGFSGGVCPRRGRRQSWISSRRAGEGPEERTSTTSTNCCSLRLAPLCGGQNAVARGSRLWGCLLRAGRRCRAWPDRDQDDLSLHRYRDLVRGAPLAWPRSARSCGCGKSAAAHSTALRHPWVSRSVFQPRLA
jgi:hypothetical protein